MSTVEREISTKNNVVNAAIDASVEFEELMDKADFDSWLDSDSPDGLSKKFPEQEIDPFHIFAENISRLEGICCKEKKSRKSSVKDDEALFALLLMAKNMRLKARRLSEGKDEEKYQELSYFLVDALTKLKKVNIAERYWRILFYNELSICFASMKNSSISRGYAEEARQIIEKEVSYQTFDKEMRDNEYRQKKNIKNHDFVTSKMYVLYAIAMFNKGEAERRSYLYEEAEKSFKKIILYARNNSDLVNFNYYSAIISLCDLYIDQGRGNESKKLLEIVLNSATVGLNDRRYWVALLEQTSALIDQSEYSEAEKLLLDKFITQISEYSFALKEKHRVTIFGFNALNHFARCQIEKVRNTFKIKTETRVSSLVKAAVIINDETIKTFQNRKQHAPEMDAYKNLIEIYKFLAGVEDCIDKKEMNNICIENLTLFLSKGKIKELNSFASNDKMPDWIETCEDLGALVSSSEIICELIENKQPEHNKSNLTNVLVKLKEKIKKECDDKGELHLSERVATRINEVLGENVLYPCSLKKMDKFFPEDGNEQNTKARMTGEFSREDIRHRLDSNEKKFDKVLFKRSDIPKEHIVEIIILRRWNSFTPGLFRKNEGESLGGGYLVRVNKSLLAGKDENPAKVENIVIDPGYNFIQNFCSEGFSINDIDTIIVTHSHLDHCAELLPVMDLIFQINKRYEKCCCSEGPKKRVNLCLSQGAYKKFSSYTRDPEWQKQLKDVIIIENYPNMFWKLLEGISVLAIPTRHMDLGGMNAIGLKIEVGEIATYPNKTCIGFTGDTPWYKDIKEQFKGCDVLCVHLGSLKYEEIGYNSEIYTFDSDARRIADKDKFKKLKDLYAKSNHLLFFGTQDLVSFCSNEKNDSLFIIGEFGEELKYGLRMDLCEKLSKEEGNNNCLPGDIALYVAIDRDGKKKVRCNFCEEFVDYKNITTLSYGRQDAINYICQSCNNTFSKLQKQAFVEYRETRH